jgi:hypothetical protein
MWTLLDGRRPPGDKGLGDALGQQTRGARLKIEQLLIPDEAAHHNEMMSPVVTE